MKSLILTLILALFSPRAIAGPPVIWGAGATAQVIAPGGLFGIPNVGTSVFDEMTWGNQSANVANGPLGLVPGGNAGGGVLTPTNIVAGTDAGRIGIIPIGIGITANATGNAAIFSDTLRTYAGHMKTLTMTGATYVPTLSDNTNQYAIEIGFRDTVYSNAPSNDSMVLMYQQSSNTHWQCYSSIGGVATQNVGTTTVTSGWWNWKIVITATTFDCYVAAPGTAAWTHVGATITTNLPNSTSHWASFDEIIYKVASFALQRIMEVDWVKLDATFSSNR